MSIRKRNKDIHNINPESMRVRGKDLRNAIFPLNIKKLSSSSKTEINQPKPRIYNIGFTIFGKHDRLTDIYGEEQENGYPVCDNKENEYAMIKYVGDSPPRYFVRMDSRGELYNPNGIYEGGANKYLKHTGKPQWELKETNSKIFNFYLNFLKTKNQAWLLNANRGVN